MPCSFGLLLHPRSGPCAQPDRPLQVTVTIRWIPLMTAACGTRVARPARTTMACTRRRRLQIGHRVRPVLGDHRLVGKSPEGSAEGKAGLATTPKCQVRADLDEPGCPLMTACVRCLGHAGGTVRIGATIRSPLGWPRLAPGVRHVPRAAWLLATPVARDSFYSVEVSSTRCR